MADFDPGYFVDLDVPDVEWDLDRLGTEPPTYEPTPGPTPAPSPSPTTPQPVTPAPVEPDTPSPTTPSPTSPSPVEPVTPAPVTPAPVSPSPVTPAPVTPAPVSPSPVTPAPVTPAPVSPSPVTPAPVTPAPVSPSPVTPAPVTLAPVSPAPVTPAPVPPTASLSDFEVQSYYSCPAPLSNMVSTKDENGSDVLIEIAPPIGTARIEYDFQVQLLDANEDEDAPEDLLPTIQRRVGETLGEYMKSNTENGDDASNCEGYYVEDFRRRRLSYGRRRRRIATEEERATRIIDISSAKALEVDESRSCVPENEGCSVVRGSLDATYVGYNEAGVRSSVSRAVKEEMAEGVDTDDGRTYDLQFIGTEYYATEQASTAEGSIFSKIMGDISEAIPEISSDGRQPMTPIGLAISGVLAATFLVLCYVLFIKSDASDKVKDEIEKRKEKKMSKKKALCEEDKQRQTDESDVCYDLESVAIDGDSENGGEQGLEVRSTVGGDTAEAAVASVFSKDSSRDSGKASRDSGKTMKMSNKANTLSYAEAQKLDSLLEADADEEESLSGRTSSSVPITTASSRDMSEQALPSSVPATPASSRETSEQVFPNAVSRVDAGCSVRSSSSEEGGPWNPLANLFVNTNSDSDDGERSPPSPSAGQLLVDRTPSRITPSPRSSPKYDMSPSGSGSNIHQLPSISEAELPPPMNDTPTVASRRARTEEWEV